MWRKEYYDISCMDWPMCVTKFSVATLLSWHTCGKEVASSQLAASDVSAYEVLSWTKPLDYSIKGTLGGSALLALLILYCQ